ncbi:MAG: type II toxin-antitoxin system RelE/ParE family toxin [Azospirillaceae bacterium]|nr:type II toxin-antitoxin system RelE/ParE family toxin [Azospirillaceae bacterium]
MKRAVSWSRDALNELIGIARHIAKDNPDAARKVAATIRATGNALGGRPGPAGPGPQGAGHRHL